MQEILPKIFEWISAFGFKILAAIAILVIGKIIIGSLKKITVKVMEKRKVEPTISTFIASLLKTTLWVFVILAALAQVGVQTTSFMAVIGAAGLAIGLALQGSLSNFASGFLIILFRPFKVGDFVDAGGISGVISRINIFNSVFKTFDNKLIIVPNSKIMDGTITNYTAEEQRRVDLSFSVAYSSDIQKVKEVLQEIVAKHELILKEPEPFIRLAEMADSSLNFKVRVWSKTDDYWTIYFDLLEQVKIAFDQNGINIPFPQMDVHLTNQGEKK